MAAKTAYENYLNDTTLPETGIDALLEVLKLRQDGDDTFVGDSIDFVGPRVFGGQVLAQALLSAAYTLEYDKPCHSLHGYFLRGGDIRLPITYQVRRLRDGRSLSAREVIAVQYVEGLDKNGQKVTKEQVIFSMIASFSPMEGGLEYQGRMPSYPAPETLQTEQQLKHTLVDKVPEPLKLRFMRERPIEMRPIHPQDPINPAPTYPRHAFWVRAYKLGEQPVAIHQAVLAFISDYYLAGTSLLGHGLTLTTPGMQMASIDHSMHFHRPFDVTEFLLYDMWSDTTSHAKGLNHGQFWQNGHLVASTQQECLMRKHPVTDV
ncbi:acyl-CoA thioesterase II [Moraxella sp. FZLJ2107]|uniref:acyl-CoA thioesterase n=1 Tax=unclassified Moraxella TaxID=2685852 RepID=UPI0020C84D39|nr:MULTISPECIES: acyl-CoA thioesterase II [unclassified Moraxella]UTO04350.1 acyl-CoA thioesterase II [Moraxella sp. FZLJ2107]UTO23183.1 acyl-CoA thioesterase II [Moraxella sp. FZLJ2109]